MPRIGLPEIVIFDGWTTSVGARYQGLRLALAAYEVGVLPRSFRLQELGECGAFDAKVFLSWSPPDNA